MPDHSAYAAPRHAVVTLPNIISFARLCAVPLAIWLVLRDHFVAAFFLFAAAGVSDLLDGWLARRAGGTVLGAALDPLADKALMVGMYVTLAAIGQVPDWLAILVVFRDVVIVGGVILLWMTDHGTHIRPIFISKLNTALQIGLVGVVLGLDAAGLAAAPLRQALIWLVAATTLLSGGAYIGRTVRARMNAEPGPCRLGDAREERFLGERETMRAPSSSRAQRFVLLGGIVLALLLALELFASILLPFVAAAGIAYVLDPVCGRIERARIPRGAASLILIVGLILVMLLFVLLLYPLIIAQIGLLVSHIPQYAQALSAFAGRLIAYFQQRLGPELVDAKLSELVSGQAGSMLQFLTNAATRLVGGGYALFNVLSLVVVTPVVAFYLLRDWPRVVAMVDRWLPRRYQGILRAQAREVDRILSAWVRGQAMCCVILALFYALGLSLVGLELGLVVGLAAGFCSFIPYVGSITGAVLAVGLAFAQFPTWEGVLRVAAVFVTGQILEGYVIYPRFLGDRVELPAVWVIFALFAGGAAFGFLGVMLAVPVAATVGVLARFWLRRYLVSPLYLEPPA